PNREVKPICADGTANGGRVGRCLSFKPQSKKIEVFFVPYFFNSLFFAIKFMALAVTLNPFFIHLK
ncbi:hypothetical protein, partial [Tenacibaculum finnmarkense]|uniref:hypothetical protein n=1 Tax=Tenacibaculum finnmarkense TaxID=2781243 RepID=UPI001A7EA37D